MSKRQARMGVGGAIVGVCCFVWGVAGGLVGGGVVVCYGQGSQCPFNNLESEHFSATSGGLYSLVGSGDAHGGGGDSTVHEDGCF
jgi:hypothetical protein